jgi:hypothetical protein
MATDIESLLIDVLVKAGVSATGETGTPLPYNYAWIRGLRWAFKGHYDDSNFVIRSRHSDDGTHDEFLYDLMVYRKMPPAESPKYGEKPRQPIDRVGRPEWQVESELSSNSQDIARDFNKLLVGSAKHKLMICGQRGGTLSGELHTGALNQLFLDLMQDFDEISLFVAYLTPWKQQGSRNPGPRWVKDTSPLEEIWDLSNKTEKQLFCSRHGTVFPAFSG